MTKIYSSVILLIFCVYCANCVFPTPKSELLVEGEFLEIQDVCNIRLLMAQGEENTQKLKNIFTQHNTDKNYYLNKILKR